MSQPEPHRTHAELIDRLKASIGRLRSDMEARSDPLLEEVARSLELLLELSVHAHDHALGNRERIERLETRG